MQKERYCVSRSTLMLFPRGKLSICRDPRTGSDYIYFTWLIFPGTVARTINIEEAAIFLDEENRLAHIVFDTNLLSERTVQWLKSQTYPELKMSASSIELSFRQRKTARSTRVLIDLNYKEEILGIDVP